MSLDFEPSAEELLLQHAAREFAEGVLMPSAAELDREERFSRDNWRKLAELGFLGMAVSAEHGGSDLSSVAQCLVLEELNRACASTGVAVSVHNALVSWPLRAFGTAEQKRRYLPRLARGESIGAFALTEPGCGSDAAAIETRAVKTARGYVLSGRKSWITNGASADVVVVFATLDRSLGRRGITAFVVESGGSGFEVGRKERKLGVRASESAELVFDDLEVPADAVLGGEGCGYEIALAALDGGRIGIAAQALGLMRAALEAASRYALEREQFGQPIARFQPIQWKIADIAVDLDAARLLAWRAAWLRDRGLPHRKEASMAKLFASEAANRAADQALQIHGGVGYCKDFPVERFFRDAKATELYEGTSEIQRIVIARELLGSTVAAS
jgi:alkylation response protein AidB-like acyl-CoA dehydrogenase